jgi:hypothetical protein
MTSPAVQTFSDQMAQVSHRHSVALHAARWPVDGASSASAANAPNVDAFIALLEAFRATGGCAPAAMVDRLLQEHQRGASINLASRISMRQLFGFEWRANLWIPMFQFQRDDLSLKTAPQQVRAALPAPWSGWTLAVWFSTANRRLDGRSPVDMLDLDLDAVLQAAASCESSDAVGPRLPPRGQIEAWAQPTAWRERRATPRL